MRCIAFLALAVCAAVQSTEGEKPATGDGVMSAPSVHGDVSGVPTVAPPATVFENAGEADASSVNGTSDSDEEDYESYVEEYGNKMDEWIKTGTIVSGLRPLVVVDLRDFYATRTAQTAGANGVAPVHQTSSGSIAAHVAQQTANTNTTAQAGREGGSADTQLSVCDAVRRLSFAEQTLGVALGMALYALAVAALLSAHFRANAAAAVSHFCGDYYVNMVSFYATTELLGARLPELIDRIAAARRWPHAAAEVVHTLLVAVLAAGALNAMLGAGALMPGLRVPDDIALAGGAVGAHELRLFLAMVAVRYIFAVLTRLACKLEERTNQHRD